MNWCARTDRIIVIYEQNATAGTDMSLSHNFKKPVATSREEDRLVVADPFAPFSDDHKRVLCWSKELFSVRAEVRIAI